MTSANTRPSRSLEMIESILRQQLAEMIQTRFWTGVDAVSIEVEEQKDPDATKEGVST